jgi:hypothetical protein
MLALDLEGSRVIVNEWWIRGSDATTEEAMVK